MCVDGTAGQLESIEPFNCLASQSSICIIEITIVNWSLSVALCLFSCFANICFSQIQTLPVRLEITVRRMSSNEVSHLVG